MQYKLFLLQFDSGGPVLWQNPTTKREVLVGIISYGTACAQNEKPAINTRVGNYIKWILETTSGWYMKYVRMQHISCILAEFTTFFLQVPIIAWTNKKIQYAIITTNNY